MTETVTSTTLKSRRPWPIFILKGFVVCALTWIIYHQVSHLKLSDFANLHPNYLLIVVAIILQACLQVVPQTVLAYLYISIDVGNSFGELFAIFSKVVIAKYIMPSPLMAVLPQTLMLKRKGSSHKTNVSVFILDNLLLLFSLTVIAVSYFCSRALNERFNFSLWYFFPLICVALALINAFGGLLLSVPKQLLAWIAKERSVKIPGIASLADLKIPTFKVIARAILAYSAYGLLAGLIQTLLFFALFGQELLTPTGALIGLISSYSVGIIAAMVLPLMPSGIGIRDTAIGWQLSAFLPKSSVLLFVVCLRLWSALADFGGAALLHILSRQLLKQSAANNAKTKSLA